jgi:hypothetical protein
MDDDENTDDNDDDETGRLRQYQSLVSDEDDGETLDGDEDNEDDAKLDDDEKDEDSELLNDSDGIDARLDEGADTEELAIGRQHAKPTKNSGRPRYEPTNLVRYSPGATLMPFGSMT